MRLDLVTDGELSVLQVIWDRPGATTREITETLYDEVTDPKMSTVQKLIERMESKGCVERDRTNRAHRFSAKVSHEEFLRSRLQTLADRLCDGSTTPLVTTLLAGATLSPNERQTLRQLVERLWPEWDEGDGNGKSSGGA